MNIHHHLPRLGWPMLLGSALLLGTGGISLAAIVTKVANTKHNLSASGPGPVKATSESQICVFCHTPHNANMKVTSPLWNRELSSLTYTTYTSASMDAVTQQPGGASKLCLSCHDGTLAIGTVGVLNNAGPVTIPLTGTDAGAIPTGAGELTGYTRDIGIDLSNDHPISFTYDSALAFNDGNLRNPPVLVGGIPVVGNRIAGVVPRPLYPLDSNQMQCTTCHDPHTWESDPSKGNHKFLRGNRLQQAQPLGGAFNQNSDSICLACHDKEAALWAYSAHANRIVADETYLEAAAVEREFPADTPVWKAACLNCHDTHTVQGSKRLLREGTDSTTAPKSGGNPASEETCYQCHSIFGTSILASPLTNVPDIKTDFELPIRMPISRQPEKHNIGGSFDDSIAGGTDARCNVNGSQCGKDFMESQAVLGKSSAGGLLSNRHTECTDCHNPHRVTRNRLFNDDPLLPADSSTHKHSIVAGDIPHNNLASGSLRGTFGVEPQYLSAEFGTHPFSYEVKRGDGGNNSPIAVTNSYLTREYQICLKCHSTYAYDESDLTTTLELGYSGGTLTGVNGLLYYSDNAMEFQAPSTHKGTPPSTSDSGASPDYSTNNHRSWHPVMDNTGRTNTLPGSANPNTWRSPWNGSDTDGPSATTLVGAVGNQTMYCSDCHGSSTNLADGVIPLGGEDGYPWGPHGSTENFLLKGTWNTEASHNIGSNILCFRCHEENQYADASGAPASALNSGFGGSGVDAWGQPIINLHQRHAFYTTQGGMPFAPSWPASQNGTYRCTMCHTGTAHGWKNKAFLVNLYDLGPEITAIGGEVAPGPVILSASQPVPKGTQVTATTPAGYSNRSYYRGAFLGVVNFKPSGNWVKTDCAGACH